MVKYENKTRYYVCTVENFVNDDEIPKIALIEGIRVLRYLKGTKDVGLQFRRCSNHQEVITYTDAVYVMMSRLM